MRVDAQDVHERVRALAEPIAQDWGLEVLDVEFLPSPGGRLLRITLHRPGGHVGIEDCERVSRELEPHLEVEDLIPGRYHLEVSSPGLNRPLKNEADFVRFSRNLVRIFTSEPVEGRREWRGTLVGSQSGVVHVTVEGHEVAIPLEKIAKANLEVEF